jgi:lipid A disaccharide synthetase
MVAGEASGDLLAGLLAAVLRGLRERAARPCRPRGIGGSEDGRARLRRRWPARSCCRVRGYADVLLNRAARLRRIRKASCGDRLTRRAPRRCPSASMRPDFNLGLETALRTPA